MNPTTMAEKSMFPTCGSNPSGGEPDAVKAARPVRWGGMAQTSRRSPVIGGAVPTQSRIRKTGQFDHPILNTLGTILVLVNARVANVIGSGFGRESQNEPPTVGGLRLAASVPEAADRFPIAEPPSGKFAVQYAQAHLRGLEPHSN